MFTILVEAKDHGEVVSLSSSTTVVIHVQDGNNHLPTISGQTVGVARLASQTTTVVWPLLTSATHKGFIIFLSKNPQTHWCQVVNCEYICKFYEFWTIINSTSQVFDRWSYNKSNLNIWMFCFSPFFDVSYNEQPISKEHKCQMYHIFDG